MQEKHIAEMRYYLDGQSGIYKAEPKILLLLIMYTKIFYNQL